MSTKYPDLFAALAAPFEPFEVKQRRGGGGQVLFYISAATVANRLDEVLGPEGWDFEIQPWGADALIGTLVVRLPDGSIVRKSNVGGRAGMSAEDDDAKSAASDLLKRCADLIGIGRYLRRDGVPEFVRERVDGMDQATPSSPPFEPTRGSSQREQHREPQRGQGQGRQGQGSGSPPRSGRAMFAFVKDQEARHSIQLLAYLNKWGKLQEFPTRMIDWSENQVAMAYEEAMKKIQSIESQVPDEDDPGY